MTVRNLDYVFRPKSVALIGASKRPGSVGSVLARNLFTSGFEGPVMPVNPNHDVIQSVVTYPDVASLPVTPELAVIATPPASVPQLVDELSARGTHAVVVITAGFGESAEAEGRELQQAMLDAARPQLVRIVGPNCLGVIVPGIGLNASFSHISPAPGRLAFVAQSGAMVTAVMDWAHSRGIGFSHLVSLGGMADVDFGDMLDYLANDDRTEAILLYVEQVTRARKFMSAARAAARMKPVVVVKAGRHVEGARAAASHTGALAGIDAVYDIAFRRAGMLRVYTLEELFDAVATLARLRKPRGDRLAILTNGGGIGVLATDELVERGGRLADLSSATVERLDEVLPPTWSRGNPVDIIGDAPGDRYAAALEALLDDEVIDGILVMNCPTAVASGLDAARSVIRTFAERGGRGPTLLTSWVGSGAAEDARREFSRHGIPTYETPTQAIRAFMYLVDYERNQQMLMETPASIPEEFTADVDAARAPVEAALAEGRELLTEPEAKEVLSAYDIPVVPSHVVGTPEEAARVAADLDGPAVLKILSRDITHKSDVGGVVLDLEGPEAVGRAAREMQVRVRERVPDAELRGFIVSPMVRRPGAYELIAGMIEDEQFGPVVLFGHGGTEVEVVDDKALGLPPLNMHLARGLMSRTRIHRQLEGYRGLEGVDLDAVALTLIKVSQLCIDIAEIAELDINPLLADAEGVCALDARIRVAPAEGAPADRLAIRPYPKELEETVTLGDGRELLLRPILPEDEPSLQEGFAKLTPEEVRMRFFVPMKTMSHVTAARFTQIDYDREMALVLTERGIPGTTEIYGVVRLSADPDNERAEYAIIVRRELTGMGLGIMLMRRIIEYARERGIREIYGDVLRENETMLKLCRALGFEQSPIPDDLNLVRVTLKL